MKLSHCNNHVHVTDEQLCCYAIRHDDGTVASPAAIWTEMQRLRAEVAELKGIIALGLAHDQRR